METKDIINMLQEAFQQAIDEKEGKNGEPDDTKLGEMAKGMGEILHELEDRMIEKAPERDQLVLRLPVRAGRLTDLLCDTLRALCKHEQGRKEASDEAVEAAELLHGVFDQMEDGLKNVLEICPWLEGDENGHF